MTSQPQPSVAPQNSFEAASQVVAVGMGAVVVVVYNKSADPRSIFTTEFRLTVVVVVVVTQGY